MNESIDPHISESIDPSNNRKTNMCASAVKRIAYTLRSHRSRCPRQAAVQTAPQEAQHMPQMAQLADFMRFQAYGAAPAAVRA